MGSFQSNDIAAEFDCGALHTEADTEERDFSFARIANGLHFSFDASFAETAGNQDTVVARQDPFGTLFFDIGTLDSRDANLGLVVDTRVVERFINRLVRILVFCIFADDRDADLVFGVPEREHQVVPRIEFQRLAGEVESLHHELIEFVISKGERDFVDRKILVDFLDNGFQVDVAEEGDLFSFFARDVLFAAADQHIGLDPDLTQQADRVLGGFCFDFRSGLKVGDQREVDKEAIVPADVLSELADRFEEREGFDIPYGAADFRNDDIGIAIGHPVDRFFDLVGNVRDDLDGFPEKLSSSLLLDHPQVDLAGCVIGVASQFSAGKAFVVAKVQIRFATVVEHVDFPVLVGAHRAGVDIDVGVKLLHADPQSSSFEQHAD